MVRVVSSPSNSSIVTIECDFIKNSDAYGCIVAFEGEVDSQQINLTKTNQCSHGVFVLTHTLSCYDDVFGFDIESDGSVGNLAVPGVIMNNLKSVCSPTLPITPSELKLLSLIQWHGYFNCDTTTFATYAAMMIQSVWV